MHYILNREKILIDHSQNKQDFIYISENLIDKLNVEKDDNSKRCITYYFLKRQQTGLLWEKNFKGSEKT